jgi:hypothetical protein
LMGFCDLLEEVIDAMNSVHPEQILCS